jgi:hypothetical protein
MKWPGSTAHESGRERVPVAMDLYAHGPSRHTPSPTTLPRTLPRHDLIAAVLWAGSAARSMPRPALI